MEKWKDRPGHDRLWEWFGLTRASWITIPRVLAHEMPDDWQNRMAALLEEYDDATQDAPKDVVGIVPTVNGRVGNRFVKWPDWLLRYRHPHPDNFRWIRRATDEGRA